jgi:hypothetical protein
VATVFYHCNVCFATSFATGQKCEKTPNVPKVSSWYFPVHTSTHYC